MVIRNAIFLIFVFLIISVLSLSVLYFYDYSIKLGDELKEKDRAIQNLELEKSGLQSEITALKSRILEIESFCQNISAGKELRNPTWSELKNFLEMDQTNKLIYNETFDCSGFAIELFKRARNSNFRCAIVEIESEKNTTGHLLNAFQTVDKGLVFVDETGNEKGGGKDKIAYIKIGNPYGTIELSKIKERHIACDVSCDEFAKELTYVNYSNLFDYNYFLDRKKCVEFYEECIDSYNNAVDEYNEGGGKYGYSELLRWKENLEALESEISGDGFYSLTEGNAAIEGIEIYW